MTVEGVERATAAVFVNGGRRGSCTLVDRRHALTARHVVGRDSIAGTEVALEFPAAGTLVQAVSVDIGEWAAGMDIALLELTGDLPPGLVVPEWLPYAGATDRVRVFGYPLEERELNGIWVQAAPAGLTASGLLQIDATGAGSSLRGHSGGPVVDDRRRRRHAAGRHRSTRRGKVGGAGPGCCGHVRAGAVRERRCPRPPASRFRRTARSAGNRRPGARQVPRPPDRGAAPEDPRASRGPRLCRGIRADRRSPACRHGSARLRAAVVGGPRRPAHRWRGRLSPADHRWRQRAHDAAVPPSARELLAPFPEPLAPARADASRAAGLLGADSAPAPRAA
jgi:hypothetical protein